MKRFTTPTFGILGRGLVRRKEHFCVTKRFDSLVVGHKHFNNQKFFSTNASSANEQLIRTYVFLNTQSVSSNYINSKVLNHFSNRIINRNQLIIDLEETTNSLFTFSKFFKSFIKDGGRALFVCQNPKYYSLLQLLVDPKTKRPFKQLSYSRYWPPGLLTNRSELDRSLTQLLTDINEGTLRKPGSTGKSSNKVSAKRPVVSAGSVLDPADVSKKLSVFREIYQGIDRNDPTPPDLVFFLPTAGNRIALRESTITNRITAGVVPVYADPNVVHYPIVANHKSPHALTFILYTILSSVYGAKPKYSQKRDRIGHQNNPGSSTQKVQIGTRAFSTAAKTKGDSGTNDGSDTKGTGTNEKQDRLHSTDIAFKPNKSGWGYTKDYSSNFDNIFGKKKQEDK